MPKQTIGKSPFPVTTLDVDGVVSWGQLEGLVRVAEGVSLCLRTARGAAERGGFFFHVKKVKSDFEVFDFLGGKVDVMSSERLTEFVNHVAGRRFSEENLRYCQTTVNLRQD